MSAQTDWVVGVDGCRSGWVAVFVDQNARLAPRFRQVAAFADVLAARENPCVVAVDIPIGLPDRVRAGGRGPEAAARKHLGPRRSSVFSIPSRKAVYAPDYRTACEISLATSDPPRKVSKQGYMLFEKVREVDRVMTARLCERVFEVHPEMAFWRLNGGFPMQTPKKIKSRVNPEGLAERRALLERFGFDADFLQTPLQPGAAADDFIDACANALIAVRLAQGLAEPFPADPATDERGLMVAIWA